MSQVLNDDDGSAAAAAAAANNNNNNNNNNNTGWPVRMRGDTEVFGDLDSCGRAFTAHP